MTNFCFDFMIIFFEHNILSNASILTTCAMCMRLQEGCGKSNLLFKAADHSSSAQVW